MTNIDKYENYADDATDTDRVIMSQPSNASGGQGTSSVNSSMRPYEPPVGKWKDDFCNCFSNLWPSCCCVFLGGYSGFCLPMYLAGQVSTRVGFWTTKQTMQTFVAIIVLFWFLGIIVGAASGNAGGTVFLFYFPYVFAFFFIMYLRFKVVAYYRINESPLETCCIGFWCNPCSLCQIARHQFGYSRLLDGDGRLDAMQIYSEVPV